MKFSTKQFFSLMIALAAASQSVVDAAISRQECTDQGGVVVGDIGNGAIFASDYVCEINNEPPTDRVVAQEGEPIASEGEVCCGGTGVGFATISDGSGVGDGLPLPDNNNVEREQITRQECTDQGGSVVGDIGNGAIHEADYVCENNGLPPIATINQEASGGLIAIEGEVCCSNAEIATADENASSSGGSALTSSGILLQAAASLLFLFAK